MNLANQITLVRIFLIAPFVICLLKMNESHTPGGYRLAALVIFLVMAVSDAIDGYLARHKKQASRLGSFLDPTADKLLMTCACILLASTRAAVAGFRLPTTVVVLIVGKDLFLVLGFIIFYLLTFQVRIKPVYIGKIATFLQLSMVTGILIAPEMSRVFDGWVWLLRVIWWSAAATAVLATLIYIHNGIDYIEEFESSNMNKQSVEK